jgi:hypothetical protein
VRKCSLESVRANKRTDNVWCRKEWSSDGGQCDCLGQQGIQASHEEQLLRMSKIGGNRGFSQRLVQSRTRGVGTWQQPFSRTERNRGLRQTDPVLD